MYNHLKKCTFTIYKMPSTFRLLNVTFQWTTAKCEVEGNEQADKIPKAIANIATILRPIYSLTKFKRGGNASFLNKWICSSGRDWQTDSYIIYKRGLQVHHFAVADTDTSLLSLHGKVLFATCRWYIWCLTVVGDSIAELAIFAEIVLTKDENGFSVNNL